MIRVRRLLLRAFGGFYNDLIGRRSRLGAAAVIFHPDGRLLLVRHSYGRRNWELPGGGRQANESAEQAVLREVREEVGVEAVVERLCGIYYEPEMDQHHFAFVCRLSEGATPNVTSAELLACEYWPPDKLPRPISDFTLRRIEDGESGRPAGLDCGSWPSSLDRVTVIRGLRSRRRSSADHRQSSGKSPSRSRPSRGVDR